MLRGRFESVEEAVEWLEAHPNSLVELTIVTNQYLDAEDRKVLDKAHPGIVSIIPEIRNPELLAKNKALEIDLQKDIQDLFKEYFLFKEGQAPSDELMDLFKEVLSVEDE